MAEFGVGIIEAGTISKIHAGDVERIEATLLVAVAGPREEAGIEPAGEHWAGRRADAQILPGIYRSVREGELVSPETAIDGRRAS